MLLFMGFKSKKLFDNHAHYHFYVIFLDKILVQYDLYYEASF